MNQKNTHPVMLVECHCHTINGFIVNEWRAETKWQLVCMFIKLWRALRPPNDVLSVSGERKGTNAQH